MRARRVDMVAARSVSMVWPLRWMRRSMEWRLRAAIWRRAGTLDSTYTQMRWYPDRCMARARNIPPPPHHTTHEEAASAPVPAAHHVWPAPYSMTHHTMIHDMMHHMARIRAPASVCQPSTSVMRPRIRSTGMDAAAPASSMIGVWSMRYSARICPPSVWRETGWYRRACGGLAAAPPRMRGRPGPAPTIPRRARRVSGPCRRESSPPSRGRARTIRLSMRRGPPPPSHSAM